MPSPAIQPIIPGTKPPKKKKAALLYWIRVLTVFGVALVGYNFEAIENSIDWLHNLDTRSYNWISRLGVRKPRPQWTIGLEIDDATFYDYMKLNRSDATNRADLATLVKAAAQQAAAVIALDINLSSESPDMQSPRREQNAKLLQAIREAEQLHVPVVLGFGFDIPGPDRYPQANIFHDEELPDFANRAVPYRTRTGFDEAPPDMRAVPLAVPGKDSGGHPAEYYSLSLQIVDAYEGTLGISPRTVDALSNTIKQEKFVYTSFMPQEQFPKVSAKDVLTRQPEALEKLRHRIVIIGGNRHVTRGGADWLDSGTVAPLEMRGMYFHANRVEGLLDNRLSTPLPRWVAFVLDLVLGGVMVFLSGRAEGLRGRLSVLGLFSVPVVIAYVASVNLGYVVNFVAPLVLLLVHAFAEHYADLEIERRTQ